MTARTYIAAFVGAFAALAGLQSCTTRAVETGDIEQHADGCGAYRYRGSANIDCRYQGRLASGPTLTSASCANDSQITCTFSGSCEWFVSERITTCVSDGAECMSVYPPEGSILNPDTEYTFNLYPGETLCDPPANATTLQNWCKQFRYTVEDRMRNYCTAQTDRNEGSTTCCLNCPKPTPLPGAPALAAGELGGLTYGDDAACTAVE